MTYEEKLKHRQNMKDLKDYEKDKPHKYVASIPMRGGYYRCFSIEKKKDIEDFFPEAVVSKVKYKDK